jgi:cephalosporin hydroxylase
MHVFWQPVLEPLLNALQPAHVVEIGCDAGRTSRHLVRWCRIHGARLDLIDPAPSCDLAELAARAPGLAHVHLGLSLKVLGDLPAPDIVLIDGDHNWFTVYNEILTLWQLAARDGRDPPVLVCHDIAWPYARRDLYYDITTIPPEGQHPARRGGLTPGNAGLSADGLNAPLVHAEQEGGDKNGVRTAIEAALATRPDLMRVVWMPVMFGLAVIVPRARLAASSSLGAMLDSLELSRPWRTLAALTEHQRLIGAIALQRFAKLTGGDLPSAPPDLPDRPLASALPGQVLADIQRGTFGMAYRGRQMLLNPLDHANYLMLLQTLRPATVFELGVHQAGRSLWLADTLAAIGVTALVIGVDIVLPQVPDDPRIRLLHGNVLDLDEVLPDAVMATLQHPFLVIEDSAHAPETTEAALDFFDRHLQPGDRIVVEDGITAQLLADGDAVAPAGAALGLARFMARRGSAYAIDTESCDRFGYNATWNPNGWLVRR